MVTIKKQLVSTATQRKYTYNGVSKVLYITIHQTGNTNKGANAQAHANIQSRGNPRTASWHYQVDDKGVIQSFPDNAQCFHSGAGRTNGNLNSIAIEMCVNSDGDYEKAMQNLVELVQMLMKLHKVPLSGVVQHNHWSGKHCPSQIRGGYKGVNWATFLGMVDSNPVSKPEAKPSKKPIRKIAEDGFMGRETVRALQTALGTIADGFMSGQYRNSVTLSLSSGTVRFGTSGSLVVRKLQRKIGAKVDGYFGKETVMKLQRYLGTYQDGFISKPSVMVKALQRSLNNGTF